MRGRHTPGQKSVSIVGIHSNLSSHFGGNRQAKLAPRSLFRGALKHAGFRASGASALIPSFVQIRFGSSSHSRKAFLNQGCALPRLRYLCPEQESKANSVSHYQYFGVLIGYKKSTLLFIYEPQPPVRLRFSCF